MNNTIISYFPNYLSTDALFTKMSVLGAPWTNDVGQDMDDAYFTWYSGIKTPSSFITQHLTPDTTTANALTIARILWGIYGRSWQKLWDAYSSQYDPMENYDVTETVESEKKDDRTIGKTVDTTDTQNGTDTIEYGKKVDRDSTIDYGKKIDTQSTGEETAVTTYGQTVDTTGHSQEYTYGFNSTERVPTAETDQTGTETNGGSDSTKTDTSTTSSDTQSGTDTTIDNEIQSGSDTRTTTKNGTTKVTDDTIDSLIGTENISRTRKGNIGQNTYQELLTQEFELWKWNFYIQVFEDVDKFLALSVYAPCTHK